MEWWKQPHTLIQTNLQAKDAGKIDGKRLAGQIEELGAQTLVFNVGGIYGWYPSEVPYHHVNEYLPKNRDILREVVDACHGRGIRIVARFDFNRAEDAVYQQHPEWFALDAAGKPVIVGAQRPGEWSLLYNVCHNAGYNGSEVAEPVLTEALSRYPFDGVFFNGIFTAICHCDICRAKYRELFGEELPDDDGAVKPAWRSVMTREIIARFRRAVDAGRPGTPIIAYSWPDMLDDDPAEIAECICDESQNVLSRGVKNLADDWTPALKMKLLRLDTSAPVYGIIHSSPGMDWRHTGLPPAEYRHWLSMVPAGGGNLWHSLTGVPDTITDRRLLECVGDVNRAIAAALPAMRGAEPVEDVLLLYDRKRPPKGWLRALYERQILFGVAHPRSAAGDIFKYGAVLLTEEFPVDSALRAALDAYVREGGHLIAEGWHGELGALRGVKPGQKRTEYMVSSYLAPKETLDGLHDAGLGGVELLPFRGVVTRVQPEDAAVLATLVPAFAPLEAVGAPPERASIPSRYTDIPLLLERAYGRGKVLSLCFSLGHLIEEFALGEHLRLAEVLLRRAAPRCGVRVRPSYPGLMVTLFRGEGGLTLHLVNGTGERPLSVCVPLHDLRFELPVYAAVRDVTHMQEGKAIPFEVKDGLCAFTADRLETWATYRIRL